MSAIVPVSSNQPVVTSSPFAQSLANVSARGFQTVGGKSENDIRDVIANYLLEKFKNANPSASARTIEIEATRARADSAIFTADDAYAIASRLGDTKFRPAEDWYDKTTGKDDNGKRVSVQTITTGEYLKHLFSERAD